MEGDVAVLGLKLCSSDVVQIANKYGYVVTWISFEDSLRLLLVACIE